MNTSYVNYHSQTSHYWEVQIAIDSRNNPTSGYAAYHQPHRVAPELYRTITVLALDSAAAESAAIQMLSDVFPNHAYSYRIISVTNRFTRNSPTASSSEEYAAYASAIESTPNLPNAFQEPKANGYYPYAAFFRVPLAA